MEIKTTDSVSNAISYIFIRIVLKKETVSKMELSQELKKSPRMIQRYISIINNQLHDLDIFHEIISKNGVYFYKNS